MHLSFQISHMCSSTSFIPFVVLFCLINYIPARVQDCNASTNVLYRSLEEKKEVKVGDTHTGWSLTWACRAAAAAAAAG